MKKIIFICYAAMMMLLTACPMAELPSPLPALSAPKTQKASYKGKICHLASAGNTQFTYDAEGKLTKWSATSYTYDANGFLIRSETSGVATLYEYDAQGLLKSETVGARVFNYANGKLTGITNNGQPETWFKLDNNGRLVQADYKGKWIGDYVYDSRGNLITYTATDAEGLVWKDEYAYDDKPSPFRLIDFKGHPSYKPFRNDGFTAANENSGYANNYPNNQIQTKYSPTYVATPGGPRIVQEPFVNNYTLVYNALGYQVSGGFLYRTFSYEGCE